MLPEIYWWFIAGAIGFIAAKKAGLIPPFRREIGIYETEEVGEEYIDIPGVGEFLPILYWNEVKGIVALEGISDEVTGKPLEIPGQKKEETVFRYDPYSNHFYSLYNPYLKEIDSEALDKFTDKYIYDYTRKLEYLKNKDTDVAVLEVQGNKIVGLPVNRLRSLKKKRWLLK